ncbi:MAG: hypothetical protein BWK76_01945 [Desulfobulbaceae bacterium A2]|nr:MAG: hypothetical protein BWK76_01945 [Desulfobulbaceae bacterium A2]
MAWIWLILAGICEVGWPLGLKLAQAGQFRLAGIALAVSTMGLSGWLLWLAQRQIALGTAYAVWTGIGAGGTYLLGVLFFGDGAGLCRLLGILLIVGGVVLLKLCP